MFGSAAQAVRAAIELHAAWPRRPTARPTCRSWRGRHRGRSGGAVGGRLPWRGHQHGRAAVLTGSGRAGSGLRRSGPRRRRGAGNRLRAARGGRAERLRDAGGGGVGECSCSSASPAGSRAGARSEPLPLELERETPIVGRDAELSWLRGCWRQARRGDGRVLVVSGPAASAEHGWRRNWRPPSPASRAMSNTAARAERPWRWPRRTSKRRRRGASHPAGARRSGRPGGGVRRLDRRAPSRDRAATGADPVPRSRPGREPAVAVLVESGDAAGDGHRRLAPLGADAVREIVELYAGDAADEVSVESLERAPRESPAGCMN